MSAQMLKIGPGWKPQFHQILFIVLAFATALAAFQVHSGKKTTTLMTHPIRVMGTSCTLSITVRNCDVQKGNELLQTAEHELRQCEQLTSTWLNQSEISRINSAKVNETVRISPFTAEFLQKARQAYDQTDGAFDITCGAVWFYWLMCERENRMPDTEELARIRAESTWDALEIGRDSVTKKNATVALVTGGLAKGMAIDTALKVLTASDETLSAFVEVGGDIAVYRSKTPIEVENPTAQPTDKKTRKIITLENGGVCTSGHHARNFEIQGNQFSQILDPRTGQPVPPHWNVTVTAPTATEADYWATACEVLGKDAISRLPDGVTAEFIEGSL
ncbi:MAG: FAD:protein FMN transferase [Planctomycetia bacterium]|nr:FAD:protein FMN transferase [Planctomycetia bacterium]